MDNHFKQKLDQYRVEWDKEELWQELEPQLPQPRSRWRSYWWVLLPLLCIPTCWGQFRPSVAVNPQIEEEKVVSAATANVPDDQLAVPAIVKTPKLETSAQQAEPQTPRSSGDGKAPTEANVILRRTATSSWHEETGAPAKVAVVDTKVNHSNKTVNTLVNAASIATPPREKLAVNLLESAPSTMVVSQSKTDPQTPNVILPLPSLHQPVYTPVKGVFFNGHAGAGTLSRQIQINPLDPVAFEQLTRDKDRETPEFSWNVNLEAGYRHRSGFSLRSGLGYQQLHESFFFDEVVRTDMVVTSFDRARYYVKPSGDTLFLSGPGLATEVEARRIRHNNRMTYYQIPLFVGYHLPRNRFDFELAGGVHYVLAQQYKGRISEGDPVEIINDPAYRLQSRFGYGLRLGIQYQLFGATHLYLASQYTRSPEFVRGDASQNYQSFGLQVGVQQRLH